MSEPSKDTIYIDAEDEITAIIEKVRDSSAKVVALVLPKRSSTMQSVVNLKLLQKTANDAKKNVVLVTSDPNLLPIAGAVGMFVAKTPQSKPEIPVPPQAAEAQPEPSEEDASSAAAVAGAAAGAAAASRASRKRNESTANSYASSDEEIPDAEDTVDLDNDKAAKTETNTSGKDVKNKKGKKNKKNKVKVPNFDRFRMMLFVGIAAVIALLVGGYFALFVLPKAKITIKTDTTTVNTDLTLTASTDTKTVDVEKKIVPATNKEVKKTETEKAPATGQRNDGTKATGSMTLTYCPNNNNDSVSVPAGTAFSNNGLSFVTNDAVDVPASNFTGGGVCKKDVSKTVSVTAGQPGDQYNVSTRSYTSGSFPDVLANGSNMSGGTTKMTKVVSQQDVDGAKQKAIDRSTAAAQDELKKQFTDAGMVPLTDTFSASQPTVTSSPNVGEPAEQVTVNVATTFSELGVKTDDLKQIVEANAKKQIDTSKQVIQDNGLSKAVIRTTENKTASGVTFQLQTLVVAGPQLDAEGIKKEVAGKKKGETQSIILSRPGIKEVNVSYSPFWVVSTPKNTKHITIVFEQANGN